MGLEIALRALCQRVTVAGPVEAVAELDALPRLTDEQATHVFRIAQELLVNAARHSGGSRCTLRLAAARGRCTFAVVDDGNGSLGDAGQGPRPGVGLASVAQRVRCLHGTMHASTGSDGAEIVIDFPVDAAQPAAAGTAS